MSSAFSLFIISYPYLFAAVFGVIPAIIWLWFWLKEDIHPEPTKLIIFTFLLGMLSVFVAIPLQNLVQSFTSNVVLLFFLWAAIEELVKYSVAWIGGLHLSSDDEPIDAVIYMMVAALGFVAMENTLFLVDPLVTGNIANTLITGDLRFIGATLLHIISSSTVGIFMALSFSKTKTWRRIYLATGLILATVLHTLFNLFILNGTGSSVYIIFGFIWMGLIGVMLMFEKIKSIRAIS